MKVILRLIILLLIWGRTIPVYSQFTDSSFYATTRHTSPGITVQYSKPSHFVKAMSVTVPALMAGYGFYALENKHLISINVETREEIGEHYPNFATSWDNYMQFAPAVAVYGLNAMDVKGKNNLRDRTMIYLLSTAFMSTTVFSVKTLTHELRPDGSNFHSFPSGHTATAFAAAEFMRQEYKDQSPWYGIAGYSVAAATGAFRMYNNKHWFSDVVAGAGIGILSTKLAYWVYPSIKRSLFKEKTSNTIIVPTYQNNTFGATVVMNLQ